MSSPELSNVGAYLGRALLALSLLLVAGSAHAEGDDAWVLVEGRVDARLHGWNAACGERPTSGESAVGARYLRRGLALLPVDDAVPVFGPGICRTLLPALDTWETLHAADAACGTGAGSSARLAMRQPGPNTLTVVHQVRRTPGKGCAADVVATWRFRREGAPPSELTPARAGSIAALAPVPPPVVPPAAIAVPPRVLVEADARPLPPSTPPFAARRLPLFGLAGLLVLVGVAGLIRHRRRAG